MKYVVYIGIYLYRHDIIPESLVPGHPRLATGKFVQQEPAAGAMIICLVQNPSAALIGMGFLMMP